MRRASAGDIAHLRRFGVGRTNEVNPARTLSGRFRAFAGELPFPVDYRTRVSRTESASHGDLSAKSALQETFTRR
jgi:hypothetical protein